MEGEPHQEMGTFRFNYRCTRCNDFVEEEDLVDGDHHDDGTGSICGPVRRLDQPRSE